MKIILAAINAKYIHSNLAVHSMKAYAQEHGIANNEMIVAEYTINQQIDQILSDLYTKHADVICFSSYIWNIVYVRELIVELRKILPSVQIWVGGPEVSYDAVGFMKCYPQVDGAMMGEGEATFVELLRAWHGEVSLADVKGITYRVDRDSENTVICENEWRQTIDLSTVPFIYKDLKEFTNRIIYYESSRGCPFSCSYCLSSIDKCLRFRSLDLVLPELQFFIDNQVPQVKFVDRTFNIKHDHTMAIWSYIHEHDNGITNFHFEISADLLNEEELELLSRMRPGLVQLEIGVQSTNPDTVKEIRRTMHFEKLAYAVNRVREMGNIHQHLDLIAGLPFEDYESFHKSFDDVYALQPEQLQLGFLKVLKGSYMHEMTSTYELVYQDRPPFEVLSTKWLPYADVIRLKRVEEMTEVYYNSGQFTHTLAALVEHFRSPFALFEALGNFYLENGLLDVSHNRIARYEILLQFIHSVVGTDEDRYKELLTFDLYLRENVKNRPAFCGEVSVGKDEAADFYDKEAESYKYLKGYEGFDKRQLRKMTHLERFDGKLYLFDYQNRNPFTNQAAVYEVENNS